MHCGGPTARAVPRQGLVYKVNISKPESKHAEDKNTPCVCYVWGRLGRGRLCMHVPLSPPHGENAGSGEVGVLPFPASMMPNAPSGCPSAT